MTNRKLDILIRKNRSKSILIPCLNNLALAGFEIESVTRINLEESDHIKFKVKKLSSINRDSELISGESTYFIESLLLNELYLNCDRDSRCYVWTNACQDCGMFEFNLRLSIENILQLAKIDYQNTCYIITADYRYSFAVTYNDSEHSGAPNTFDIQRWILHQLE